MCVASVKNKFKLYLHKTSSYKSRNVSLKEDVQFGCLPGTQDQNCFVICGGRFPLWLQKISVYGCSVSDDVLRI